MTQVLRPECYTALKRIGKGKQIEKTQFSGRHQWESRVEPSRSDLESIAETQRSGAFYNADTGGARPRQADPRQYRIPCIGNLTSGSVKAELNGRRTRIGFPLHRHCFSRGPAQQCVARRLGEFSRSLLTRPIAREAFARLAGLGRAVSVQEWGAERRGPSSSRPR